MPFWIYVDGHASKNNDKVFAGYVLYNNVERINSGKAFFKTEIKGSHEAECIAMLYSLYNILDKRAGDSLVLVNDTKSLMLMLNSFGETSSFYKKYAESAKGYLTELSVGRCRYDDRDDELRLKEAHNLAKLAEELVKKSNRKTRKKLNKTKMLEEIINRGLNLRKKFLRN
ncbi:hypothetical protein GF374_01115 [Candidatus Woesearchaeota archaeon]|nr:hypothetical protein [Candidatus Woesearchaeota archaeon]